MRGPIGHSGDQPRDLGDESIAWPLAQIREGARVGKNSTISRGVYLGPGVTVGANCKIQNFAQIFEPAILGDGVFVGPMAILTNDKLPRAVTADGQKKSSTDWNPVGVVVHEGASIGASATCIAPVVLGAWSMIAAGAVVAKDVPAFALVAGCPAEFIAWVCKAGHKLIEAEDNTWNCSQDNETYKLENGQLMELM